MCKNRCEILAPAGNMESLRSAVINGADAVYLGASAFSARAKAGNFTSEELIEAVKYCHLFDVKVYLAINTIIKPSEYDRAVGVVFDAKNAGVDAFIIQDLPFLAHLHSIMPDIIIHLSTQAGIHNLEGAKVAERLGATRIILSREVLLDDIKEICKKTSLEVECFIHGALCVSFSGNCYISSLIASQSGNRGKCLQFCRKNYSINEKKGYLLSAKDLNLSNSIQELVDAGVTSFKIEGRMRRPEYVGETVRYYSELLKTGKQPRNSNLDVLFNRGGGCEGYLLNPTASVIYPKTQGHIGAKIGTVNALKSSVAKLKLSKPLCKGDGIKFIRNGKEVGSALIRENGFETTYLGKIKVGDEVNVTTDTNYMNNISSRTRNLDVEILLNGTVGNKLLATLTCKGITVTASSDFIIEQANKSPILDKDFLTIFNKTDKYPFNVTEFASKISGSIFVPKSSLNDFRRNCYEKLYNKILSSYKLNNCTKTKKIDFSQITPTIKELNERIIVQTDDLDAIKNFTCYDAVAYFPQNFSEDIVEKIKQFPKRVFLVIPPILRGKDRDIISKILSHEEVRDVIINNISGYEFCKGKNILPGHGLNIINPNFGGIKILSPEYDGREYGNNFVYAFGKFPLMNFAHCPKKTINNGRCVSCNQEELQIKDETGVSFQIRFYKIANCYAQQLGNLPIDGISTRKLGALNKLFIDLIGFNNKEKMQILSALSTNGKLWPESTSGYFNKKLD